ncbi:hypothetical protein IW262DRAFT_1460632 [Armillaria fumosa]|nr:hypothetical protein IW262DRAFT_1460632 [Armillaria fumosa]
MASPVPPRKTKDDPEDIPYPGAFSDFYGLPSNPFCIYRTGTEWPVPKGPQAQRVPREASPVCNHPIQAVWPALGEQVYELLDSLDVKWSTIDPVRFAEEGGKPGPLHLWKILAAAQFPDVEIAFRESVFTRSTGPQLLNHVFSVDPTFDIRSPFTGTPGIPIAPRNTPHLEGTGALYLCEGGQSDRIFLLTARHVPLPPGVHSNKLYERKRSNQRRHEVLILGSKAYQDALEDMMVKIAHECIFVDQYKTELGVLGEGEDATVAKARQKFKGMLTESEKTITAINKFHSDITKHWSTPTLRVLGYVVHAPPLSVSTGPKKFTEDWALIDIYRDKIDWNRFKGNVVHLGNKISSPNFVLKMHPHPEGRSSFKYPLGGLLQVKDVVKEDEIRQPTQLDANGEECLIVIKNGRSTGVTIGRGTGIESFVREYDEYGIKSTSMALAVHPYSHKDGAFSAPGDSGSIVVDGQGRIVGLLIGGSGKTDSTDVTYLTPYFWLEEQIKKAFPNSYLYAIKE